MTKVKENWFESWFDTKYYHILYKHRDNVEANLFIGNLVKKLGLVAGMRVADICCGKGRHSIELSNYGLSVWGMDLSQNSINEARKLGNDRTSFDVHDMRESFPKNDFNTIFNLFTSFGYFGNEVDDLNSLTNIHHSLKLGGTFIQDYIHADYFTKDFPISEFKVIEDISFNIEKFVECGFIVKQITVTDENYSEDFFERVKIYSTEDLVELHVQAGFSVENIWGNYSLDAFYAKNSPRIILNSRKL